MIDASRRPHHLSAVEHVNVSLSDFVSQDRFIVNKGHVVEEESARGLTIVLQKACRDLPLRICPRV